MYWKCVVFVLQNKSERERDRIERLNERDGLSPSSNRINRSSKPTSDNYVCTKMEEFGDKEGQQTLVKSVSNLNGLRGNLRKIGHWLQNGTIGYF